ncbi:hypothetical protein NP233_g3622 [Leucocoprinus birnbaumii]|uniref:Uncharacterized protein n=1 Tax=Leucocoprinus birnbaumii TaxID=56174 RepID=A0AAD5W2S6_9AGAR|nr:hypothetical protein NP233_g3622 [Leucocoprinus birnbaumii]
MSSLTRDEVQRLTTATTALMRQKFSLVAKDIPQWNSTNGAPRHRGEVLFVDVARRYWEYHRLRFRNIHGCEPALLINPDRPSPRLLSYPPLAQHRIIGSLKLIRKAQSLSETLFAREVLPPLLGPLTRQHLVLVTIARAFFDQAQDLYREIYHVDCPYHQLAPGNVPPNPAAPDPDYVPGEFDRYRAIPPPLPGGIDDETLWVNAARLFLRYFQACVVELYPGVQDLPISGTRSMTNGNNRQRMLCYTIYRAFFQQRPIDLTVTVAPHKLLPFELDAIRRFYEHLYQAFVSNHGEPPTILFD